MSTVELPDARVTSSPAARAGRRGLPGLRGTGIVGHLSAAVLALAGLVAIVGRAVAPYDPDLTNLKFAFVGAYQDHYLGFDSPSRPIVMD